MKKDGTGQQLKGKVLVSALLLLACVFALIGTTLAWFTAIVTNDGNRIEAGSLKVDLLMDKGNGYQSIAGGSGDIFNEAGNGARWEPGRTEVVYLAVQNAGNLALKYNINLAVLDDGLANALEFVVTDGAKYGDIQSWTQVSADANVVADYIVDGQISAAPQGRLSAGQTDYFALSVHMMESAGNEFALQNFSMDVKIVAGQAAEESDGFGNSDYDADAPYETGDGNFSGGFGTPESPYLISTKEDLMAIGYKGFGQEDGEDYFYNHVFQLTDDIDMENEPIKNLGSFRGLLDGNGYSLKNVNFTSEGEGYSNNVGLFAGLNGGGNSEIYEAATEEELSSPYCHEINGKNYIITSGAVMNLTFESGTIYSDAYGAVSPLGAGQNTAYVINVTNNVDIVAAGEAYFIAGIVSGTRGTGLVINCTNNGDITYTGTPAGSLVVGGITSQLYGGSGGAYPDILRPYSASVYGCVNNGNIYAEGRDVGGIVGQTHGYDAALKKAIINCTNNGDIAGMENVGGIVGRNSSTGVTLYLLNNVNAGTVSIIEGGVEGTSGEIIGKAEGTVLYEE